jgi:HAE1 family hydrophobic/amphiphilic exporter-1/multidrug efflux pump
MFFVVVLRLFGHDEHGKRGAKDAGHDDRPDDERPHDDGVHGPTPAPQGA